MFVTKFLSWSYELVTIGNRLVLYVCGAKLKLLCVCVCVTKGFEMLPIIALFCFDACARTDPDFIFVLFSFVSILFFLFFCLNFLLLNVVNEWHVNYTFISFFFSFQFSFFNLFLFAHLLFISAPSCPSFV